MFVFNCRYFMKFRCGFSFQGGISGWLWFGCSVLRSNGCSLLHRTKCRQSGEEFSFSSELFYHPYRFFMNFCIKNCRIIGYSKLFTTLNGICYRLEIKKFWWTNYFKCKMALNWGLDLLISWTLKHWISWAILWLNWVPTQVILRFFYSLQSFQLTRKVYSLLMFLYRIGA